MSIPINISANILIWSQKCIDDNKAHQRAIIEEKKRLEEQRIKDSMELEVTLQIYERKRRSFDKVLRCARGDISVSTLVQDSTVKNYLISQFFVKEDEFYETKSYTHKYFPLELVSSLSTGTIDPDRSWDLYGRYVGNSRFGLNSISFKCGDQIHELGSFSYSEVHREAWFDGDFMEQVSLNKYKTLIIRCIANNFEGKILVRYSNSSTYENVELSEMDKKRLIEVYVLSKALPYIRN